MNYAQTKVYNDGSHFIGIPKTTQPWKKKKPKPNHQSKEKEIFNQVYKENNNQTKREKIENISKAL